MIRRVVVLVALLLALIVPSASSVSASTPTWAHATLTADAYWEGPSHRQDGVGDSPLVP